MMLDAIKNSCAKVCKDIKNNLFIAIIVIVVVLGVVGLSVYYFVFKTPQAEAVGRKAVEYVSKTYIEVNDSGIKAVFKSAEKFSDLYKVVFTVNYNGQDQDNTIYVTKEGRYIFPEMQGVPIDMEAKVGDTGTPTDTTAVTTCDAVKKVDKASVEAFVVSKCPYGLQMQRVLSQLIKDAPATKENITVRYFGTIENGKITSMHGDEEAQENLRQICLREETTKYWSYLSCHMQEGKTTECLTSAGVDKAKLTACMTDPNRGLKFAQSDFDLANQLGVSGSPTLFINGDKTDEFSFGGRTEDALKQIICCGSTTQGGYCATELSKDSAATSFSKTYGDGTSGSGTGTGTGANCAPAQ